MDKEFSEGAQHACYDYQESWVSISTCTL